LSLDPETRIYPSGEKEIDYTPSICALNIYTYCYFHSHIIIVLSLEPDAMYYPLGEYYIDLIDEKCFFKEFI